MRVTKSMQALVGPGSLEYADEITYDSGNHSFQQAVVAFAEEAVRKLGFATSRKSPEKVKVQVCTLTIERGKMVKTPGQTLMVMPPYKAMTEEEFEEELAALLADLPPAFHPFVREKSWDDGHSAGLEEVITLARNLICGLKPCVDNYTKELRPNA